MTTAKEIARFFCGECLLFSAVLSVVLAFCGFVVAMALIVVTYLYGELGIYRTVVAVLWCCFSLGGVFKYAIFDRFRLTLRQCLCVMFWLSIGCSLSRDCYPAVRRGLFISSGKTALCELEPETSETVSRLVLLPLEGSAGMLSEPKTVLQQIDRIDGSARALVLISRYARWMRARQDKRWQLSRRIMEAWCAFEALAHSREQNLPTAEFEQAHLCLQRVLDEAAVNPLDPLQEERPQQEIVRLAVFDVMNWPGLSPAQMATVQGWEAKEPYIARLLLVDLAVTNAHIRLRREHQHVVPTEDDAVKKLRGFPAVNVLLGDPQE